MKPRASSISMFAADQARVVRTGIRSRLAPVAMAIALAGLLTACGGSPSSTVPDSSATSSSLAAGSSTDGTGAQGGSSAAGGSGGDSSSAGGASGTGGSSSGGTSSSTSTPTDGSSGSGTGSTGGGTTGSGTGGTDTGGTGTGGTGTGGTGTGGTGTGGTGTGGTGTGTTDPGTGTGGSGTGTGTGTGGTGTTDPVGGSVSDTHTQIEDQFNRDLQDKLQQLSSQGSLCTDTGDKQVLGMKVSSLDHFVNAAATIVINAVQSGQSVNKDALITLLNQYRAADKDWLANPAQLLAACGWSPDEIKVTKAQKSNAIDSLYDGLISLILSL